MPHTRPHSEKCDCLGSCQRGLLHGHATPVQPRSPTSAPRLLEMVGLLPVGAAHWQGCFPEVAFIAVPSLCPPTSALRSLCTPESTRTE